jgi:flagellar biosynthetic protein FlhB
VGRSEGRTEKPTERRKRKIRREGRTAKSHEIAVALSLVVAVAAVQLVFPAIARQLMEGMSKLLRLSGVADTPAVAGPVVLGMVTASLVPLMGLVVVAAVGSGLVQTGFSLAPAAAKPKLSNLSPSKGLQRLKPATMAWEATRSAIKIGLIFGVTLGPIRQVMAESHDARGLVEWLPLIGLHARSMLVRAAGLAIVVAVADYAVTRFKSMRSIKMTRQELKEEVRETEGDPFAKGARRRRALELSRNRMIADVTTADVLITNPTHFAVALKYSVGEPAPRVVAKGAGAFARKLRRLAHRNGVLVREDPPLARAIFRRCKVGHFIPTALYEAVAVILAVAYRRRRLGVM